ncbi:Vegetative incompatibility protein HET-E-1 [Fusarium culmorum]|uniref:Vegetative incompatibility protein HET-E-1 n=1 Tax=Fusarium culmorum TaxID=5516 RepID=A0A2T4GVQ6_FUSCU|nr:Vegetative incompatibility protein HET-E-1 [Fusarium culmorum]
MRLIQYEPSGDYRLERELGTESLPKYAILSHTWMLDNEGEVSLRDLTQGLAKTKPEGYEKIRFCGERAAHDGLNHFWIDTCCIDQNSSAVLEEAITSMYAWYRNADRCYVYLWDITLDTSSLEDIAHQPPPMHLWESAFRRSRWFTRGWTLQELLAPQSVTGIPVAALRGTSLASFSVEERLCWTENRQTKRKEDKAYCLLGIFGVSMNHRYGEGDKAFERLRRKIENKNDLLSTLTMAKDAAFNSLHNQHEPICLEDTRSGILNQIRAWAEGSDSRCIFWLNGIAGTGKSTIARTIARVYYDVGALGGSYFFSKGGGDLSKSNRLVTTLAGQLAAGMSEPRRHISEAIAKREDIVELSLRDQWKHLIIDPLSKIPNHSTERSILLVIDALDECNDENDIRAIIKILATAQTIVNFRLRILITSRPETPIRHGFNQMSGDQREVFVLEDISPSVINQDIGLYFRNRLKAFCEERGFDDDDWPDSRSIMRLVENASGLFIWAATACRFICKGTRFSNIEKRLRMLIHGFSSGDGPEKKLDQIYITVLRESAMRAADDEKEELYLMLRQVIGAIAILYSPLHMEPLSRLLDLNLRDVNETLNDLHTILYIPKHSSAEDPRPVRLHHPTFRDFLLNKDSCIDVDFFVDEKKAHRAMGINDVWFAEADIPNPRDDFNYVSDLAFTPDSKRIASGSNFEAVRFWDVATKSRLRKFEGGATDKMSSVAISPDSKTLAGGSDDFTVMVWSIENGALHYSVKAHTGWVNSVVFSPDGTLLASGSMDQTVALWDVSTGQEVKRIDNQSSCVNSATFSPNGAMVATGSVDGILRIWHLFKSSDEMPRMLDGHSGPINSVRYSPSGSHIVSGSDDMMVRLWNAATEASIIFRGHTKKVMAVAFAPDGHRIASGSEDKTVGVWDATSGACLSILLEHISGINSVVFSPDCNILASSSFDDEVRLWDVRSWEMAGKLDEFDEDVHSGTLATQRMGQPSACDRNHDLGASKGHSM